MLEGSHDLVFRNSFKDIRYALETLNGTGARYEFECYDTSHLYNLHYFWTEGLVKAPLFIQTVFGLLGGIGAHPEDVMHMKRTADRLFGDNYRWSVLGAGRAQMPVAAMAAAMGGNVRVGLEDSLWIGAGQLAAIQCRPGDAGPQDHRRPWAGGRDRRRGARNSGAQGRRQGRILIASSVDTIRRRSQTNRREASMLPHRRVYDEEHKQFRETRAALRGGEDRAQFPAHGKKPASSTARCGRPAAQAGLLCPQVPEEFGGAGGDFRHNAVVIEELSYSGFAGPATDFSVHNDVCCGYLLSYGTPEQKKKWLPRMVVGRNRLRHRDDRTRHRQRPAGHPHPRRARGRRVRDLGPENLHLQRADVRSRHRRGQDHAGRRLARNEPHSGRDRPARLSPRPEPREARASLVRYVRIVLRSACASPSATCWARKAARWAH